MLEGISTAQQQYVRQHLDSVVGEGGTPVLVFDGRAYPAKAATRAKRRGHAAQSQQEALQAERRGERAQAATAWKKAAAPQEAFWLWLMQECLRSGIKFIVSPYEADAQLVALEEELGSSALIWAASQDSDLVAFGGREVIYECVHVPCSPCSPAALHVGCVHI